MIKIRDKIKIFITCSFFDISIFSLNLNIQSNKHKKQVYYFILVNVGRNKLKIFNKFELIKSFRIKDRGFYIYSSNKLTN